jgi:L-aspartate oxidase
MTSPFDVRRHLTNFDSDRMGHLLTDVLVIGTGVAGCRAAIEAAAHGSVILIAKGALTDSATALAQGGLACALGDDDDAERHFADTLQVGCGLNGPAAVRLLVEQGPACIEQTIAWGLAADCVEGRIDLGREAGHSRNRIVHAHGDQTGRALADTLVARARATKGIRLFENCFLIDLIGEDCRCVGAVTHHPKYGHQMIWARQIILASGGCGRIWRESSNPPGATGDGLAVAFRAGARLRDMELMQFHPTTLYVAGSSRALISEAVRGEGAYLVDRAGARFMEGVHPDAELAPRDVVSQAIHRHLRQTRTNCVYLDVRHIAGFAERFPQVARRCADFEIDVSRDLIPVRPSAHYMIGGVEVALDGSTSIDGLLACGEAASTGVHGANRLASNSLLEGLVFGKIAGETAGLRSADGDDPLPRRRITSDVPDSPRTELDLMDIRNSLRSVMWRNAGIERSGDRLAETGEIIEFWGRFTVDKTFNEPMGWEVQNELTVARLVAMSALARTESIGVHFRTDAGPSHAGPSHAGPSHAGPSNAGPSDAGPSNAEAKYHVRVQRDPAGTKTQRVEPDA